MFGEGIGRHSGTHDYWVNVRTKDGADAFRVAPLRPEGSPDYDPMTLSGWQRLKERHGQAPATAAPGAQAT